MYNNDYIIAVDENGQPYIAHRVDAGGANGAGRSTRRTKFIAKFPNLYRMGKTAYAYTQQQVEAMQRHAQGLGRKAKTGAKKAWGSKVGRFIDEHDAGISEEIMRRRLNRKYKSAVKKGDYQNAGRYGRRAAELRDEAKSERQRVKDRIGIGAKKRVEEADAATRSAKTRMNQSHAAEQRTKSQADNLREAARNASGEKFNQANTRYSNATSAHNKAQAQYEADTKAYRDAVREGHKANQIYNDSIIGTIERKIQMGKKLTKDEAEQFAAFLARVRGGNS